METGENDRVEDRAVTRYETVGAMADAGLGRQEIAQRLGIAVGTVANCLYRWRHPDQHLRIHRDNQRRRYAGKARSEGVPQGKHRQGSARAYGRDDAAILHDFDSGMSFSEVAKKHGVTRNVVAGIVNRRPEARA